MTITGWVTSVDSAPAEPVLADHAAAIAAGDWAAAQLTATAYLSHRR